LPPIVTRLVAWQEAGCETVPATDCVSRVQCYYIGFILTQWPRLFSISKHCSKQHLYYLALSQLYRVFLALIYHSSEPSPPTHNHALSLAIRSYSCCCLGPSLPCSRPPPAVLSRLHIHGQRSQQHDLQPGFYLAGHIMRSSIL